ncbi:MAG: BrnA antitoxin family protein, partial [Candidatus Rokuibacteriota bacterium]
MTRYVAKRLGFALLMLWGVSLILTSSDFWTRARLRLPPRKIPVSIRLDEDVISWFRERGGRYQTR